MNKNKNYVLITGATSGIGYELTQLFAKERHNLVLVARSEDELHMMATNLHHIHNIDVIPIAKDLFRKEAPFEVYEIIKAKGVTVDILVNDAGQGQYGEFIHTDLNKELDIIQLNVGAVVTFTKLFLREMVARKTGKILNLSSIAAKLPGPLQAVYHATKAFVQSFTMAVREEVKYSGVTVTALLPGVTDTDFFHKAHMEDSKMVQQYEMSDPAEVAKAGYEALMNGDEMVTVGFKNKVMKAMASVVPDNVLANRMHKQQEPVEMAHPK